MKFIFVWCEFVCVANKEDKSQSGDWCPALDWHNPNKGFVTTRSRTFVRIQMQMQIQLQMQIHIQMQIQTEIQIQLLPHTWTHLSAFQNIYLFFFKSYQWIWHFLMCFWLQNFLVRILFVFYHISVCFLFCALCCDINFPFAPPVVAATLREEVTAGRDFLHWATFSWNCKLGANQESYEMGCKYLGRHFFMFAAFAVFYPPGSFWDKVVLHYLGNSFYVYMLQMLLAYIFPTPFRPLVLC